MTIAEALLPVIKLHGAAKAIAEKHYSRGLHGPGAKEHVLARIYESSGDEAKAEEYHRRAIMLSPEFADYHISLGLFLIRKKRVRDAIRAFENARPLAQNESRSAFIESRIAKLRTDSGAS
jgi:Tfp pilus assembly protein PilF